MMPAEFDYVRASSVEEAAQALRDGGEDAKLIAGGHSLLPLMKLRLAAPSLLIDIGGIDALKGVNRNGGVSVGALTTHTQLAGAGLGVLSEAASTIADPQVRNRGTIGGSIAHGDPASDLPAVVLALEGTIVTDTREIQASEFFQDYLMTALEPHEVVREIRVGDPSAWGHGYQKFNRRNEDWAMVAVAALVRKEGDTCADVRIGLTHMAGTPLRATAAEEALRGQPLNADTIRAAADQAAEGTSPPADLNASAAYKQHLARVLCRRALAQAAG
jgi:aerobic carbon-monoxide dehydrogenase medium subunit